MISIDSCAARAFSGSDDREVLVHHVRRSADMIRVFRYRYASSTR
jgi:hypothetical protein